MPNRLTLDNLRLKMSPSVAAKNTHLFTNGKEKTGHRTANKATDVEPNSRNDPVGEEKTPRFNTPCRVHLHQRRHKLCDTDGASAKAVLDGLVKEGIFKDDSPAEISQVTHSQEKIPKTEAEKTIITIEEV